MTIGDNKLKANWQISKTFARLLTEKGGTVGFNYADGSVLDSYHSSNSNWLLYGSETASAINSRGIYYRTTGGGQTSDKQLTSYDNSNVGWGATASNAWYTVLTRDFAAGEYVWTGFDYLGEPTPWNGIGSGAVGSWPSPKNSYFGIIDTAGFAKDSYYFYQSQWNDDVTTLHVLPACIIGAGIAGALSQVFGCTLMAPHGGIFVFPVVGNALLYLLALVIGTVVSTFLLGLFKKKVA